MFSTCYKERFNELYEFVAGGNVAIREWALPHIACLSAEVAYAEQRAELGFYGTPGRVPEHRYCGWIRELAAYVPGIEEEFDKQLFDFYGYELLVEKENFEFDPNPDDDYGFGLEWEVFDDLKAK